MRVSVTATMAASALAIGLSVNAAQSLSPGSPLGDKIGSPDASVQQAQQKDKGMGPGGQGPGMGGSGQGGGRTMQDGGGKMRGDGGGLRQGGSQFRSGEKGIRGEDGRFGYRDGRDRDRRRFGRGGVYFGPGYGYLPASCDWLRRRALATDSPYWWRRYRACRGG